MTATLFVYNERLFLQKLILWEDTNFMLLFFNYTMSINSAQFVYKIDIATNASNLQKNVDKTLHFLTFFLNTKKALANITFIFVNWIVNTKKLTVKLRTDAY